MNGETKVVLRIAATGFGVGIFLGAYSSFYLDTHHPVGNWNGYLFLILCLPTVLGLALENATPSQLVVGWLVLSVMNAFIYLLICALLRSLFGWFKAENSN